jgi:hypothetical protein
MAEGEGFIQGRLQAAVIAQMAYEKENWALGPYLGVTSFSHQALYHFGEALHTVTDSVSPWHRRWSEVWLGGGMIHGVKERATGRSREVELAEAKYEARVLWYRFLMMLEDARKKEEKEKEEKEKEKEKGKGSK